MGMRNGDSSERKRKILRKTRKIKHSLKKKKGEKRAIGKGEKKETDEMRRKICLKKMRKRNIKKIKMRNGDSSERKGKILRKTRKIKHRRLKKKVKLKNIQIEEKKNV